jgi:hypothetical protein
VAPILSDYLHAIKDSSVFDAVASVLLGIDFTSERKQEITNEVVIPEESSQEL